MKQTLKSKKLACNWTSLLLLALVGCQATPAAESAPPSAQEDSSETPSSGAETGASEQAPEKIWTSFVGAFNARDTAQLSSYGVSSGLLLLDNPGAFVRVRKLESVPALLQLDGNYDGARLKEAQLQAALSSEEMPQVSCEDDQMPQGVYWARADGQSVLARVNALEQHELASAEEVAELRPVAEQVAKLTSFVVYDASQSFRFYFAIIDAQPKLLAVDAVVPCSA